MEEGVLTRSVRVMPRARYWVYKTQTSNLARETGFGLTIAGLRLGTAQFCMFRMGYGVGTF
jgi:hypothetical protein